MRPKLSAYATLVFDCDGVVLDSNCIKTEAFRVAALPFGEAAAEALVAYHVVNGGVSRYAKFRYFLDHIVPELAVDSAPKRDEHNLDQLLRTFGKAVRQGLLTCEAAPGLAKMRAATRNARWCVVSGSDQAELRDVFVTRGLTRLFDGGIFGSPETKDDILAREISTGNIRCPALFLGDSRYDHASATLAGLDFVFVYGWTEAADWQNFVRVNQILALAGVAELLTQGNRLDP